jgi:hypothetical protein
MGCWTPIYHSASRVKFLEGLYIIFELCKGGGVLPWQEENRIDLPVIVSKLSNMIYVSALQKESEQRTCPVFKSVGHDHHSDI